MILRSVARHVREQNWTAIGIDFLIVVIQVSNWNADRHEALRAQGYLSRIQEDLTADQQSLAAAGTALLDHQPGSLHDPG